MAVLKKEENEQRLFSVYAERMMMVEALHGVDERVKLRGNEFTERHHRLEVA